MNNIKIIGKIDMISEKTKIYIEKARLVHGEKYDYSMLNKVEYKSKQKIICPEHGVFEQRSDNHLQGKGCRKCRPSGPKTNENNEMELLKEENEHLRNELFRIKSYGDFTIGSIQSMRYLPNKYSSMTKAEKEACDAEYYASDKNDINNKHVFFYAELIPKKKTETVNIEPIIIPEIKKEVSIRYSSDKTNVFISKAEKIHGKKYDYSLVDYQRNDINIKIICLKHGEFNQTPNTHLKGSGCKICGFSSNKKGKPYHTTHYFISKAKEIHGDTYDYSLVDYKQSKENVTILCSVHGEFEQLPNTHLKGHGCKKCGMNKRVKSENEIDLFTQTDVTEINEIDDAIELHDEFEDESFSPEFLEFLEQLKNNN